MKKLLSLLLVVAVVFGITACTSNKTTTPEPATTAEPQTTATEPTAPEEPAWTPSKTVEFICFYSAGGSTDLITRAVAQYMDLDGQSSTVSNITGGNTNIGMTDLMNGDKSGNRICLFSPETMASYQATGAYEGQDYLNTVNWLPVFANDSLAVFVKSGGKYATLEDLVNDGKAREGTANEQIWAGPGTLGGSHLAAIGCWDGFGYWGNWVMYPGNADARTAVLGDNADVWIGYVSEGKAYVESGDLTCLAVCATERNQFLPDVPCTVELGFDVTAAAQAHRCLILPDGVPEEAVKYYYDKTVELVENEEFKDYVENTLHFTLEWYDADEVKAIGEKCYSTFEHCAQLWNEHMQ